MRGLSGKRTITRIFRSRARWSTVCACALLLSGVAVAPAAAGRPGFERLTHLLDAELFEEAAEMLVLSDPQRQFARGLFDPYFEAVRAIEKKAADDRLLVLERRREEAPTTGQAEPDLSRKAAFTNDLLKVDATANRRADALLREFFGELQSVLSDEQRSLLPAARRMIRRANHLAHWSPHMARLSRHFDLTRIVREASAPDGELYDLLGRPLASEAEEHAEARDIVRQALESYELSLDAILRSWEAAVRSPRHRTADDLRPVWRDTPSGRRHLRDRGRAWYRVFSCTDTAAETIAAVAHQTLGPEPAERWEKRYWHAWHPEVIRDLPLDGLSAWVDGQPGLTPDFATTVKDLFAAYLKDRHECFRRVFRTAVSAKRSWGIVLGDEPEHVQYARAVISLIGLHDRTVDQIAQMLPEEQRDAVRQRFTDEALMVAMCAGITLNVEIQLGLKDPAEVVYRMWDAKKQRYVEYRPVLDPTTGRWIIDFSEHEEP